MFTRSFTDTLRITASAAVLATVSLFGCGEPDDVMTPTATRVETSADPTDAGSTRLHEGAKERLATQLTTFIGTPVTPGDIEMRRTRMLHAWPASPIMHDAVLDGDRFLLVSIDRPDLPLPTMTLSVPEPLSFIYMGAAFVVVVNEAHGPFVAEVEMLRDGACLSRDVLVRHPDMAPDVSCSEGDDWDLYEQCLRRICSPMGCTATIVDCRVDDDCSDCEEPATQRCEYLACQDGYCTLVEIEVSIETPCPADECFFGGCDDSGGVIQDIFGD